MKKKLLLGFLSLLAVALVSCGEKHGANDAWSNDDSYHWHECNVVGCDEKFDRAEHAWGEWVETKQATCKQAGEKTRECSVCGTSEVDIIERLKHTDSDYVEKYDNSYHWLECSVCNQIKEGSKKEHQYSEYVSDNNATCSTNGTETAKCDGCSKTNVEEVADSMTEHEFVNYISNNDATCTQNATETAKCNGCDETHTKEIADSKLAHELSSTLQHDEETHYYSCANCDYIESVEDHVWSEWNVVKEPTFDEEGSKTSDCSVCNYNAEVAIPVLTKADLIVLSDLSKSLHAGDSFILEATIGPVSATNYRVEWSVENTKLLSIASEGKTCTVTSTGVLGRTVITLKVINELNGEDLYTYEVGCTVSVIEKPIVHYTFNNGVIENIGSDQSIIGKVTTMSGSSIIDATSDVEYTEGKDGSTNGAIVLSQKKSGGNHFTINGIDLGTGDFTIKTNLYVTGGIEKDGATYLFGTGNETDPLGNIKDVKAPYFNVTIKNNNAKNQVRFVADSKTTLNNTNNKGVYITAGKWTEVTVVRCNNTLSLYITEGAVTNVIVVELSSKDAINITEACNLAFAGNYGCQDPAQNLNTYYDEIIIYDYAITHMFGEYVSNNDATCTQNGTETSKCLDCELTKTREELGSKLDHTFENYVSDNNATCTLNGTETAKCENCDATDTKEIADSTLEHTFTVYVSNGDGTKTAQCDYCEAKDTKIDDTTCQHQFSETYEYNEKYHWYPCTKCDEIIDPVQHELSDWSITQAPTFDEEGLKARTCECGYVDETEAEVLVKVATVGLSSNKLRLYSGQASEYTLTLTVNSAVESAPNSYRVAWEISGGNIAAMDAEGATCALSINGTVGTATVKVVVSNVVGEEVVDTLEATFTLVVLEEKEAMVKYTFENGIVNEGTASNVTASLLSNANDTRYQEVTDSSYLVDKFDTTVLKGVHGSNGNSFGIKGIETGSGDFTITAKYAVAANAENIYNKANQYYVMGTASETITGNKPAKPCFAITLGKDSKTAGYLRTTVTLNGETKLLYISNEAGYFKSNSLVEFVIVKEGTKVTVSIICPEVEGQAKCCSYSVEFELASAEDFMITNDQVLGFAGNYGATRPGDSSYYDDICVYDYAVIR